MKYLQHYAREDYKIPRMSLWRKRNKEKPQIIQAILPMPNSHDWSRRVGSDILKDFADECGAAFEFAKKKMQIICG